jgi:hypothetical protein
MRLVSLVVVSAAERYEIPQVLFAANSLVRQVMQVYSLGATDDAALGSSGVLVTPLDSPPFG